MVSGLGSHVQLFATELALKAIGRHEAVSTELTASTTIDPSLTSRFGQSEPAHARTAAAHEGLTPRLQLTENADPSQKVTSTTFMRELKLWLADLTEDRMNFNRGCEMLQAFASSTLKVFDPVEGIVVIAGDVAQLQSEAVSAAGWSQFLKRHVKREADNAYSKDEDGNYVDLLSGERAYFGAVGSKFYYFTWP